MGKSASKKDKQEGENEEEDTSQEGEQATIEEQEAAEERKRRAEITRTRKAAKEEKKTERKNKRKKRQARKKAEREAANAQRVGGGGDGAPGGEPDDDGSGDVSAVSEGERAPSSHESESGVGAEPDAGNSGDHNADNVDHRAISSHGHDRGSESAREEGDEAAFPPRMEGDETTDDVGRASSNQQAGGDSDSGQDHAGADPRERATHEGYASGDEALAGQIQREECGVATPCHEGHEASIMHSPSNSAFQTAYEFRHAGPSTTGQGSASRRSTTSGADDAGRTATVVGNDITGTQAIRNLTTAIDGLTRTIVELPAQQRPVQPVARPTDPALLSAIADLSKNVSGLSDRFGQCHNRSPQPPEPEPEPESRPANPTRRSPSPADDDNFWTEDSNHARNTFFAPGPPSARRTTGILDPAQPTSSPHAPPGWRVNSMPLAPSPSAQAVAQPRNFTDPSLTPIGSERARGRLPGFMGNAHNLTAARNEQGARPTHHADAGSSGVAGRMQGLGVSVLPSPQLGRIASRADQTAQGLAAARRTPRLERLGYTEREWQHRLRDAIGGGVADASTVRSADVDRDGGSVHQDEGVGPLGERVQGEESEDTE
ncbi:hypothetical protein Tdes44962_MAKER00909 [Teratosphaeria destructans]|uniref:Uncharacterized protein n=1 Tax=Teratosphaeria destructans TaxID=418781 RepID=A0A9W7SJA9_9PEZI|nr:hypothetical protein Tdes44962_MAKER00909 [Teratosphaeria destructans]